MSFLTNHLKQAKQMAGDDAPVTLKNYWEHFKFAASEGGKRLLMGIQGIIHAVFPWWFGFDLIAHEIKLLKNLKEKLPNLPIWDTIEFKEIEK